MDEFRSSSISLREVEVLTDPHEKVGEAVRRETPARDPLGKGHGCIATALAHVGRNRVVQAEEDRGQNQAGPGTGIDE